MRFRIGAFALVLGALEALGYSPVPAQSSDEYSRCVALAQQQSGDYGEANSAQNAPLKGAAAGAAGGAFLGGITGGNAGTGAAIGAAFGAIAGGVRNHEQAKKKQNAQNNFYNAYNACMSQR
ncbi:MAG TPA: YMGG-like glycine zipper-containing protein [Candidatus Cybelea sp.]|jgi:outer membrane lipoprotein SlyB